MRGRLAGGLRTADSIQKGEAKVSTATMGEAIVRELDKVAALGTYRIGH